MLTGTVTPRRPEPIGVPPGTHDTCPAMSRLEPRKGFPDPGGFREHARGALASAAPQLDGQGPLAAHYALARRLLID